MPADDQPMTSETRLLDSYQLTLTPMEAVDIPRLHELSVGVGWPHRPEDWALLIESGTGTVARDEIGRIVGSAMWFPLGADHAAVGMVITSPRLQEHGAGRWLMGHILDQVGARGKVLNSTRAAYRLYISMGFGPLSPSYQCQGMVTANPPAPGHARPMGPEDIASVQALDAGAMGFARPEVLARLLKLSTGVVVESGGAVTGFALCRKFGRGHVVGPIVAASEEDAMALVAPFVTAMQGQFLRVDTRQPQGPFRAYLTAAGMGLFDTVTRMGLGPAPEPSGPAQTFGLVNQALG